MVMQAGRKRSRIVIQTPVKVKGTSGAVTTTWVAFGNPRWAAIETMRSFEKQAAQTAWPGADCTITIKYIAGLLPTMRILYNDKIYSILGINDLDERHRDVELTCKSGVAAQ